MTLSDYKKIVVLNESQYNNPSIRGYFESANFTVIKDGPVKTKSDYKKLWKKSSPEERKRIEHIVREIRRREKNKQYKIDK